MLLCDELDDRAQASVGRDASREKHLLLPRVGEGSLRHLTQHGVGHLLEAVADVLDPAPPGPQLLDCGGEQATEAEVHALDDVGERYQPLSLEGELLHGGTAGVLQPCLPGECVEAVADRDVEGLAEDPVPPSLEARDDRVPAGDVEGERVYEARRQPPDLDVGDAVVHAYQGYLEVCGEGP